MPSFKRPWGSYSNLGCTLMSLLKGPLWCLQAQQNVLGNTTSLVKTMAASQKPHIGSEQPFCFSKEYTPHNSLLSINRFFCQKLASLIYSLEWKIRDEAHSTTPRHFRHFIHSACRTSDPREHWVHLKITFSDIEFHQSTGHPVNWQAWSPESTFHSPAAGRPLGQHPRKHLKCMGIAKLPAYRPHDNQEQLLICTCVLHLPNSAHGAGKVNPSAQPSILSPTEHRSSPGNYPQPVGSLLPNFPGWYLMTQQEPTS